mmetsp:Transcript_21670/g.44551  ORF Transcript_21670/g.44551 Transcript_21670/m.44551 type:complete len:96 (+) Transcript_21670:47-334(+)
MSNTVRCFRVAASNPTNHSSMRVCVLEVHIQHGVCHEDVGGLLEAVGVGGSRVMIRVVFFEAPFLLPLGVPLGFFSLLGDLPDSDPLAAALGDSL